MELKAGELYPPIIDLFLLISFSSYPSFLLRDGNRSLCVRQRSSSRTLVRASSFWFAYLLRTDKTWPTRASTVTRRGQKWTASQCSG